MNTEICTFSVQISRWNIVCNKELSAQDWKAGEQYWYEKSHQWQDFSPKLAFLPAIKRRRLSDSARLFFEAAWDLLPDNADIPIVYASANSEINRSFALWQSLLQESAISPTSFSLSVHNALVGQWSEFRRVKSEITAITARQDNLETALMEAYLLLNEGHKQILVVVAESPLYTEYNAQPVIRQPFAYALAMVVEKGEQYRLKLTEKTTALSSDLPQDNALNWVKNQYTEQSHWQSKASGGGIWLWQKN